MKKIFTKWPVRIFLWVAGLIAFAMFVGLVGLWLLAMPDRAARRAVAETRQLLRQQGFKTDVEQFDFSTSQEFRIREAAITNAFVRFNFQNDQNLMEPMGNNSAVVVWKQPTLKNEFPNWPDQRVQLAWEEFRTGINSNGADIDAATAAVVSGPLRFNLDASRGSAMLLRHLATLKKLEQMLGNRMVLELHDGDLAGAFTNLLAATRVATDYEPEPVGISHLVRMGCAVLAFNATWQALQTNGWSEAQLSRLQAEWERMNLFENLPEATAFKRAGAVLACKWEREQSVSFLNGTAFSAYLSYVRQQPGFFLTDLKAYGQRADYARRGSYEDENDLLIFFRNREIEFRRAICETNWLQMRALPGVTNHVFFFSKQRISRVQSLLNMQELGAAVAMIQNSFLGSAAKTEALRRIVITALALERFHNQHAAYPKTLAELTPDFLPTPPVDFMDGQPLRYRLNDDGRFQLYSIGLDCVDNGGRMHHPKLTATGFDASYSPNVRLPQEDLVWPLPASESDVLARRAEQQAAANQSTDETGEMLAQSQWNHATRHQMDAEKILAEPAITNVADSLVDGRMLSERLHNPMVGTNRLSLCQLLTLNQIVTGAEPETFTFELPIAYAAMTNLGSLNLFVDANNDDFDGGALAQQAECVPNETNGNCRLVWSTLYESPGLHAVQAGLTVEALPPDKQDFSGPFRAVQITNFCQFSAASATYDVERGALFQARLPEKNGTYEIECVTTNGVHLKTLAGSTTNGEFKIIWDLVPDDGKKLNGETFNSTVKISLPDSGRTQTMRGP